MPVAEVTFLGTSGGMPTKERALPALLVRYFGTYMLFDCGEGTQYQFIRFSKSSMKVRYIFISHCHGDHSFGLPGFLNSMQLLGRTDPLDIFVPKGQEKYIERLIFAVPFRPTYPLSIHGVNEGTVVKGKGFEILAYPLKHTTKTLAYVFKEEDKLKADKEKLRKLGLLNSPKVRLLKQGKTIVHNGKTVRPEDVLFIKPGVKIVYAVDTRPVEHEFAKDADLLIHEATFTEKDRERAIETMHTTAKEAAELAKRLNVKKLILTHISPRYKDVSAHLEEARRIFPNTDIAHDGFTVWV